MHKRAREFSRRSVHRSGDNAFVVGPTRGEGERGGGGEGERGTGGEDVALRDKRAVLLNSTRSLK